MKIRYNIMIAKALLLARWKQTLVAAIGVTFSLALFIALLGFMEGLNQLLDGLILNRTPHIRLYNDIRPSQDQPLELFSAASGAYHFISSIKPANARQEIYNAGPIMEALKNDQRVTGVAPRLVAQAFYNLGNIDLNGIINGIEVEEEAKLFSFPDYVTEGRYMDVETVPNSIILGKAAAETMMAEIGDLIVITTAKGDRFPLKVVGFFQSGIAEIDKVQSYASITTTQKILGKTATYITDIQVKVENINQAPAIAAEYRDLFGTQAEDIQTANAQFETGSSIRSIISYAVGITLLIVSGFGIYNILNMMIYEKMDTIAILKATGFSGRDVKRIFITIALSIGIFGVFAGSLFGFLIAQGIDQVPFDTPSLPTIDTYPIDYNPKYYLIATVFGLLTTYLAGWFPASRASGIDPVIIIRGK